MKSQCLKYKGYLGSIEMDMESDILHGKLLFVNDLATYEAETIPALQNEFELAVDDYLRTCEQLGKDPDKPFSGTFNVRVGSKQHREIALYVELFGLSGINGFINEAVSEKLARGKQPLDVQVTHRHIHSVEQAFTFGESGGEAEWEIEQSQTLQ